MDIVTSQERKSRGARLELDKYIPLCYNQLCKFVVRSRPYIIRVRKVRAS